MEKYILIYYRNNTSPYISKDAQKFKTKEDAEFYIECKEYQNHLEGDYESGCYGYMNLNTKKKYRIYNR